MSDPARIRPRRDSSPSHDHLLGAGQPGEMRNADRAAASRRHAEIDFRQGKHAVFGCETEIASER
jgi:hypothetical protein